MVPIPFLGKLLFHASFQVSFPEKPSIFCLAIAVLQQTPRRREQILPVPVLGRVPMKRELMMARPSPRLWFRPPPSSPTQAQRGVPRPEVSERRQVIPLPVQ